MSLSKFADLHLHTIFSDSTYSPQELILEAARQGLSVISVVDHDTVDGLPLTIEIGKSENIEVLPGIELTAEYQGLEVHILGYLIDYRSELLREALNSLRKNRIERIYRIIDRLKSTGINLSAEAVFEVVKQGVPTRLHIARAMVKEGIVSSTSEAFSRYIGDKCYAYVGGFELSPYEAIGLIRSAQGIAVLAHPYTLGRDELISDFVDYKIMGLEVYYPEHTEVMRQTYLGLAQKYNLLVTGGSDCHGSAKPSIRIGSIKIPYDLVEKLKMARKFAAGF